MATLQLFDSHFHVWDLDSQRLEWLGGVDEKLRRTFRFGELSQAYDQAGGVELIGALHVEADVADAAAETGLIEAMMGQEPLVKGYVAHSRLEAGMDIPDGAVGVREVLHNEDIPRGRCLEESFIDGLGELARRGLSFDACIRVEELADLYEACARVPEARVIINHCGNAQELTPEFQKSMRDLAQLPQTYCKVSGLPAEADHVAMFDFLAECFGTQRLMYASNWPVVALYSDFRTHLSAVREYFADDRDVFAATAQQAYRLKGSNV